MDNIKFTSIKDVSETLLLPLYCRAMESKSKNPVLVDKKAMEIVQEINPELEKSDRALHRKLAQGKLHKKLPVTVALRTRRFDRYILDFLKKSPDGIVVNLGCGLIPDLPGLTTEK